MISCYNLIGKNVLSLVSGKIVGVVKNIEIKNMRLTRLLAFNDDSEIEEEFLFSTKNVFSFGENAITLKKEDFEIDETYLNNKIVGAVLYNQQGEVLDCIVDVLVDETTLKISEFVGESRKYAPSEIANVNNGVVVLKGNAKIVKTKNIRHIKASETPVKILNSTSASLAINIEAESQNEAQNNIKKVDNSIKLKNDIVVDKNVVLSENSEIAASENAKMSPTVPTKTLANFEFLIGRIASQNIYSTNGSLLIKLGEIIKQETVVNAFTNKLLKELLENSKPVK